MTGGAMFFLIILFVLVARWFVAAFDPMGRGDESEGGLFYRLIKRIKRRRFT